jgi:hypothetical protein
MAALRLISRLPISERAQLRPFYAGFHRRPDHGEVYKGGEKKIVVLPQTRIVTFVPGDRGELKPGVKDGTLEAGSLAAGRDGLPPPM